MVREATPTPSLFRVSSKKRLALSWASAPFVPANITEPAVGANHDGVPAPPETKAKPELALPARISSESVSDHTIPPFETESALLVPPLAVGRTPETSVVRSTHPVQERSLAVPVRLPVTFP